MIPDAPLNVAAVATPVVDYPSRIHITWDAVPDATYTVYRNGVATNTQLGDTELDDSAPLFDTYYMYTVTATVDGVESAQSEGAVAIATEYTNSFATKEELAAYWRPLTASEDSRATTLLAIASSRLRYIATSNGINIDTRISAVGGAAYKATVQWVVMESVKRALQTPTDQPNVETFGQTAGPYSENYKYANPTGDLWFRKSELAAIGLSGKQRLNSVSPTTRSDIYGDQAV
jgi:hypothetical protein